MGTSVTKRRRAVVTGTAGFLGGHVAKALRDRGYSVAGVDIRPGGGFMVDLRNMVSVVRALERADLVVHLAADMGGVGYFHSQEGRVDPFMNNMRIDMNVLEACQEMNVSRLFFSSSACVYPTHLQQDAEHPPKLNESMIYPANADEHYGWSKLMMLRLCEESPLDARVGILHTVYGPGQEWEGKRAKFPPSIAGKAIQASKDHKPIEIWGDGSQRRSYLYVDDAVKKIISVIEAEDYDGPVNIGSEGAVSCLEVAKMCCEILNIDPGFTFNDAQPSGVLGRDCDNSVFRRRYKEDAPTPIEVGFDKLMGWIEAQKKAAA